MIYSNVSYFSCMIGDECILRLFFLFCRFKKSLNLSVNGERKVHKIPVVCLWTAGSGAV